MSPESTSSPADAPHPMAPGEAPALLIVVTGLFAVIGPTALQVLWLIAVIVVAVGRQMFTGPAGQPLGARGRAGLPALPVVVEAPGPDWGVEGAGAHRLTTGRRCSGPNVAGRR